MSYVEVDVSGGIVGACCQWRGAGIEWLFFVVR